MVLASILVLLGTFEQILAYFIFVTVLFLELTVAALFVIRRSDTGQATYRTPGYPVTPLIFLALVSLLLFMLAARNPLQAALGSAMVALGIPIYLLVFRRS